MHGKVGVGVPRTNFVVASVFSPIFQVYFEASSATAIYKLVYEWATYGPSLKQI